jgi:hypothetical protein
MNQLIENYRADAIKSFESYKKLAERAIEQLSDDEFFRVIDVESNSVAVILKHIAGNQISRWTDFLTTDGEKPDRNRDAEFEMVEDTRGSLMDLWERGWKVLFKSLEDLTVEDLAKSVTIRGEPHTVIEAINRQLTHYAYHIGQIVFLAKHFRSTQWKTLSVPKNRSGDFNDFIAERKANGIAGTGRRLETALEFAEVSETKKREGE